MNQVADEESRTMRDCYDWMLHPQLFSQIEEKMGPLEVDMLASQLTHQLPRFFISVGDWIQQQRRQMCATSRLESILGVCESSMVSPFAYIGEDSAGESQSGLGG